ncbi:sugar phosphate isomerase/epimerase family protein [Sporomusa sp.]|uniref:sugar phosphate isomerase/epimerase family protein n=1 Tax=Sporomusa sp. TaxID=2078658 RepID=UPI002CC5771B|nr:TIM barrel protein [Sporomusa sp.]HWR09216.1 TIM barrel protein [Sporomusa sp.]
MLQLVNLSNYATDNELINNSAECLQEFLTCHHLDGIEMMFCGPLDENVHRKEWIHGVHLRFWPWWLDFWRGDRSELLKQFGNEEDIKACYGGITREEWLNVYRENITAAQQAGAKYVVFHVSHARISELFSWRFHASDREIIEATVEVINQLQSAIPADMTLLFENLWWPGLTLQSKELTAQLLDGIAHRNVGIMLDTGHLMNTNPALRTQAEGVDYILKTISRLGSYGQYIKGIHLHHSLSGEYIKSSRHSINRQAEYSLTEVMTHVLKIDEHRPFSVPEVRRIVDYVQPDYLVHEFMKNSMGEWVEKINQQQQALNIVRVNK